MTAIKSYYPAHENRLEQLNIKLKLLFTYFDHFICISFTVNISYILYLLKYIYHIPQGTNFA